MRIKSIAAAAAALVMSAVTSLSAAADSSGFYTESELALAVKAPYDTKYTNVTWSTSEAETVGVPVAAGARVALPVGNKVNLLSEKDGSLSATIELSENASEQCRGAALGNTLIQPTRTGIAVINLQTDRLVQERSFDLPISSDAAMIDSRAYFAAGEEGDYTFFCVDLSNNLEPLWEYRSSEPISAPSIYGERVVFATGTRLVSADSESGQAVENDVGAVITGAPFAAQYAVYVSAEDGCVYKLRLNSDGTLEEDTLTPCKVGGALSSPLQWNGRVYVASSEGFFILDSLNMSVTRRYDEIKGGTAPIVCFGSGTRVYTVAPLEDYWCLYCIFDMDELDEPQISKLAKLQNFEGGRVAVSDSGTMYFRDGIGRLFALIITDYNIFMIVLKLVLLLALIVLVFIWLRQWAKQRNANRPPEY